MEWFSFFLAGVIDQCRDTIIRAREALGVTNRSAALNVAKLVDAGVVVDMGLGRRPKYFMAHEGLEIIHWETP